MNRTQILFALVFLLLPLWNLEAPAQLSSGVKAIAFGWASALRLDLAPLWTLYREVWPVAALLIAASAVLWWWSGALQGRIKDQALRVWTITG